jgi:hypothetical protein
MLYTYCISSLVLHGLITLCLFHGLSLVLSLLHVRYPFHVSAVLLACPYIFFSFCLKTAPFCEVLMSSGRLFHFSTVRTAKEYFLRSVLAYWMPSPSSIEAASIGTDVQRYYCRAGLFGSIGIVNANSSPWVVGWIQLIY